MAIEREILFVIIPIEDSWFDFSIRVEDKCAVISGKDKKDGPPIWVKEGDFKNYDTMVLIGCAFEQSRSDNTYNHILGEGLDDDGKKYLIIDRRETYDGNKLNESLK